MFLTDETMDEIGADYDMARFAAMDGRDNVERFVSESDYFGADYQSITECLTGMHVQNFRVAITGSLVWYCEECPRDIASL